MKENKKIQQILQWLGALNRFARIGIFLAIVLPVSTLATINYFTLKKELNNSAFSRRLAIAQVAAITLSQKFDHLKDIGTSLTGGVHFRELISKGQWFEGIKIMSEVTKNLPIIDRALLVDVAGNVKADWYKDPKVLGKNFNYREWYQKIIEKEEPYVSNIYKRANEPLYNIIAVAVPIKNENNKLIGILLLQVLLDPPFNWVKKIQIGPSGYIYLVDGNGKLAFHPKYSSQFNIIDYTVVPVVKKVLQGKEGVEVNFNLLENEERISAYSPVPGYKWGVVVQEPTATAFAFRNSSLKRRLFESFIIIVFTGVLALVVLNIVSKLNEAKMFSDLLIDNIPDMVFVKDAKELKFVRLNKAGEELLGYSQNEMIGKSDHDFFPKSEADFFIAKDRSILLNGKSREISEETIHTRLKGVRILNTRKVPLNSKYLIGISEDITDKIGLIEARLAQQAAEEMAKRKSKFLDIAAHELRTPITTLSLLIQLAEKQALKGHPLTIDVLARLRAPTDRLTRLIVDLLDMSRLDRKLLVLLPVQTNMTSLISECVEEFRIRAPERSFFFNRPDQPVEINADPLRINQVLANLLDNAVKYTKDGTIEVALDIMPNTIRVSVTDHGSGISKEQQAVLFTAFSRGNTDSTIRANGLGLGLSICHGILDLHGGTIGLVSKEGEGSTFYFELPRKDFKI